jgi:outer membrane autotransporter protein
MAWNGTSPNQRSVNSAVQSLGVGNSLYDSMATLSASRARQAFDALSGDYYASRQQALIRDTQIIRGAVGQRLTQDGAGSGDSATKGRDVWIHAYDPDDQYDASNGAGSLDHVTRGVVIGADKTLDSDLILGVVMGYGSSTSDVDDHGAHGDGSSYQLGLYSGRQMDSLSLNAGLAYAWNSLDSNRNISALGDNTRSSQDISTAQVFAGAGYDFAVGASTVTPFAQAAYVHLDADGFTEKGGPSALTVKGSSSNNGMSEMGVRINGDLRGAEQVKVGVSLAWQHTFGDLSQAADMTFTSGGSPFTVNGVSLARDSGKVGFNLTTTLSRNFTPGLSFSTEFGDGMTSNAASAYLKWNF